MSQSADGSRLSKTHRADRQNAGHSPSAAESRSRPLTERDGVTLRDEARDGGSLGPEERALSWGHVKNRWRHYIEDRADTSVIFENRITGARAEGSDPHRFAPDYAAKQYAKLKDLERGVSDAYGKRLHTAMLTLTASSTDDDGRPLPPVDHLDSLLGSWDAVRRALDRSLDSRRYERLAILEPHKSGYLHVHVAVFVDGHVTRRDFAPVIEAHLRNCQQAGAEAHDVTDDSTISVRHAGADRDLDDDSTLDELAIYLAEYLGAYSDEYDGPLDAPEHVQAANALLWATQRQRWRPSAGAQELMATNRGADGESHWSLVAISDGDEEHDVDPASGGVSTFTTGPRTAGTDPPP